MVAVPSRRCWVEQPVGADVAAAVAADAIG